MLIWFDDEKQNKTTMIMMLIVLIIIIILALVFFRLLVKQICPFELEGLSGRKEDDFDEQQKKRDKKKLFPFSDSEKFSGDNKKKDQSLTCVQGLQSDHHQVHDDVARVLI